MTPTSAPDDLERLRMADPLRDRASEGASPEALRARIAHGVSPVPAARTTSPRRTLLRRRVVPVASVTVALLATTTVGYALLRGGESASIGCVTADAVWVIDAVSSDPVADCVARLAADGETIDPETLGIFVTDDGTVIVAPDETTAADVATGDLSPAPGLRSETDLVELRMAIADVVTGVGDCSDADTVAERARAIADRVGFGHWDVVERERPDEPHCGWAFADLDAQQIVVVFDPDTPTDIPNGAVVYGPDGAPVPVPEEFLDIDEDANGPSPYAEIVEVSRHVHDAIGGGCLSAAEAEDVARSAVAGTSQAGTVQITVNDDPNAACARVHTNAHGGYDITIFGPDE